MRQLRLQFRDVRELGGGVASWVDADGVRHWRRWYPHCVDFAWPWWKPGFPWRD